MDRRAISAITTAALALAGIWAARGPNAPPVSLVGPANAAQAGTAGRPFSGRATVIDGDTIRIGEHRIRLNAIDAPERRQTCIRQGLEYRCGETASAALRAFVAGRSVTCQRTGTDRYKRIIAKCAASGQDLGAWLVGEGWAIAYRRYGQDYVKVEEDARANRRGMWEGVFQPPEQWRRTSREGTSHRLHELKEQVGRKAPGPR